MEVRAKGDMDSSREDMEVKQLVDMGNHKVNQVVNMDNLILIMGNNLALHINNHTEVVISNNKVMEIPMGSKWVVDTVKLKVMEEATDNNNRWEDKEVMVVKDNNIQIQVLFTAVLRHQCHMVQPSNKTHLLILNVESYSLEQLDL